MALALSPSAEAQFWFDPAKAMPPKLVSLDQRTGGGMRLRKRIASAQLLRAHNGCTPWVLRRSTFEPLLTDLRATDLALVPVEAYDADGLIDDDWMFLHVLSVVGVDQGASTFGPHPGPGRRREQPLLLRWTETPAPALFRLSEYPGVLCASSNPAVFAPSAGLLRRGVLNPITIGRAPDSGGRNAGWASGRARGRAPLARTARRGCSSCFISAKISAWTSRHQRFYALIHAHHAHP